MKRYLATFLLGLGVGQAALGGPSPIYQNFFPVSQAPVVDAIAFFNASEFNIDAVSSYSLTNLNNLFGNGYSVFPFMTKDTLYYTNSTSGVMTGEPGFRFDTGTSTFRHSASSFLNQGTVQCFDTPASLYLWSPVGSTSVQAIPTDSQPIPSQLLVLATNIVNTGSMAVGDGGLLKLAGMNVTNANATLSAGSVDTGGLIPDPLDTLGLDGETGSVTVSNTQAFFVPSPGVYDTYWGVTNGLKVDVSTIFPPFDLPDAPVNSRGFSFVGGIFGNFDTAQYTVSVHTNTVGTNIYYNVVFVNTNFADTNLSASVAFSGDETIFPGTNAIVDAFEDVVQIAEPVYDVITGQTVTNAIYLIDDGAIFPNMILSDNASLPDGFSRPDVFSVVTETPPDWFFTEPANANYDPTLFYTPQEFANQTVPWEISEYGAQIGRNPADLLGSFSSLLETNSLAFDELEFLQVNLPDPTNDPARIEITANNLDLTQSRVRAEGMVVLNVTNLIGGGTVAEDWGEANANIGVTNGALVLSNIFPTTFHRVRGELYAYSASWQNVQTNLGQFIPGGPTNTVTNQWFYHILVVDQNMFGSFPSTLRSLNLTASNSIVLQDNLNIINQAALNTTNLTINSSNYFTQNAANFVPANVPFLKNLLINSNGLLGASGGLDIGFNVNQGQAAPAGRKYTVSTITNFGQMLGTAPLLQAATIENDGQITANNEGSIIIEANSLGLGLALTNTTNYLLAAGNVDLSATTIGASNSVIYAGFTEPGSLTLEATKQLSDFVSGVPTTNTNSVIINNWTTTGGFSLPIKPATGDLFGTQIHTIATNFNQISHVWAGTDMGATPAGFVNNEVIGRLILDRQSSNSLLRFSAAGTVNAMYVDYLELTNFAYTNYRSGLLIDPNFTIYFAGCNVDPEKLMEVYPRMKWVQNFAGPNSSVAVPYINSSNICLMNTNLAFSFEISFFNGLPNFYNQPFILNDPSNPNNIYPCPGDETTSRSLLVATPVPGGGGTRTLNLLNISVNGDGSITPGLSASQMTLGKSYALTAKPAKGWVFQNWTTIGLANAINANSPTLSFNFVSNTVITANFVPNPFGSVQSVYNGLFFEPGAVDVGSSGAFTLTLTTSGSFSGRLLMGPKTYLFNSQFSGAGGAQFQARSGTNTLAVNLQLDLSGQTGRIIGDVNGGAWDAPLAADVAPIWTLKNPSPMAGKYTAILPWPSGSDGGGDGYGTGTISPQGVLTLAGSLADGVTFSRSAPVSQSGDWPFYVYAAAGKDSVLGWITVSNGLVGTNITWTKSAAKGVIYAGGFTNALQLAGLPWQTATAQIPPLTLADPFVTLSNGGLQDPLIVDVSLKNYLTYLAPNLSLSINAVSGSFSGWFNNPDTGRKQTMSGVVLQKAGVARGFFKGANESGAVILQGGAPTP